MSSVMSDRTLSWAALAGGFGWALLPVWETLSLPHGVGYLFHVLPLALIGFGLLLVRRLQAHGHSRAGGAGVLVSLVGVTLMTAGNAVEVTTLTMTGEENETGHLIFFLGLLLVLLPGSLLLGVALWRTHLIPHARLGGGLLATVLPLGILFGMLAGLVTDPEGDTAFWTAIATPYGLAWAVTGVGLVARTSAVSTSSPSSVAHR